MLMDFLFLNHLEKLVCCQQIKFIVELNDQICKEKLAFNLFKKSLKVTLKRDSGHSCHLDEGRSAETFLCFVSVMGDF